MKHTFYIKSKFFIRPIALKWLLGILFFIKLLLSDYIPKESQQTFETILSFIYIALFIWATFYLFFKSFDNLDMESEIEKMEEERERALKFSAHYKNEKIVSEYKKVQETITNKKLYTHFLKTRDEITSSANTGYYLMILLILFLGQHSFDFLKPIGPNLYIFLITPCIIFCVWVIIREGLERKTFASLVSIGHVLAIYLLFSWGKNSYIRSYGSEIIGSYLEKPEYRTQYYVNVFTNKKDSKNYRLVADIHVYSESEESESSEDRFGQEHSTIFTTKYIVLEKVYWPNGAYFEFNDCQLKIGDKVLCDDQDKTEWYIELTKQKVK